jgi:hypothetical protein
VAALRWVVAGGVVYVGGGGKVACEGALDDGLRVWPIDVIVLWNRHHQGADVSTTVSTVGLASTPPTHHRAFDPISTVVHAQQPPPSHHE